MGGGLLPHVCPALGTPSPMCRRPFPHPLLTVGVGLDAVLYFGDLGNVVLSDPVLVWGAAESGCPKPGLVALCGCACSCSVPGTALECRGQGHRGRPALSGFGAE